MSSDQQEERESSFPFGIICVLTGNVCTAAFAGKFLW